MKNILKSLKLDIKKLDLMKFQKLLAFIIIVFYLLTYIIVFKIKTNVFDTETAELVFLYKMQYTLLAFSSAFLFIVLTMVILMSDKPILSSFCTMIMVSLQKLYLGIPKTNEMILCKINYKKNSLEYDEVMNVRERLKDISAYAESYSMEAVGDFFQNSLIAVDIIGVLLSILNIVAICTIVEMIIKCAYRFIKKEKYENKTMEIDKSCMSVKMLMIINCVVSFGLVVVVVKLFDGVYDIGIYQKIGEENIYNIVMNNRQYCTELINAFKVIGVPFCLLLAVVVNYMIKKQWYGIAALIYGVCIIAIKNIVYYFYNWRISVFDAISFVNVYLIVVGIVCIIFFAVTIWKIKAKQDF